MDFSFDTIVNIVSLLGGGGIGAWIGWRYTKRIKEAEAEQAETTAAKEVQDVYQQLIADVKTDRDEQKAYITELKEDRRHLREERDELRDRIDKTDENVRKLQREVAINGQKVDLMTPFMCARKDCADRIAAVLSGDAVIEKPKNTKKHASK